jgi:hypothetical protein
LQIERNRHHPDAHPAIRRQHQTPQVILENTFTRSRFRETYILPALAAALIERSLNINK